MRIIIYISWLLLVFSCRAEDFVLSSFSSEAREYQNKTLWKEDEIFIKNVKQVYEKNADKDRMQSQYGNIYWNYASTLNTYNETYLIAPIVQGNDVVSYVEARRKGERVFFEFTKGDAKTNRFFDILLYSPIESLSSKEIVKELESTSRMERRLECKMLTKILNVGEVGGASGDQGGDITKSITEMVCKFVDIDIPEDHCIGVYNDLGECNVEGGSMGGGYAYPKQDEEKLNKVCDILEKVAKQETTKELLFVLRTKSVEKEKDGTYKETGYVLTQDNGGRIHSKEVKGEEGTNGIQFEQDGQVDAVIHNHNPGALTVFSPYDLASMALFYKTGKIKDIQKFFFGLVTAAGTQYILVIEDIEKFNNFATPFIKNNEIDLNYVDDVSERYWLNGIQSGDDKIKINEVAFLSLLQNMNTGLKLLRGNDTFSQWEMMEKENDDKIKATKCNEKK